MSFTDHDLRDMYDIPKDTPIIHNMRPIGKRTGGRFKAEFGGRTVKLDDNGFWPLPGFGKVAADKVHVASAS